MLLTKLSLAQHQLLNYVITAENLHYSVSSCLRCNIFIYHERIFHYVRYVLSIFHKMAKKLLDLGFILFHSVIKLHFNKTETLHMKTTFNNNENATKLCLKFGSVHYSVLEK